MVLTIGEMVVATAKDNSPPLNCFTCQNRERTEWCVLSEKELELLDRGRVIKNYMAGEVIFNEGDACSGVYCLEDGLVGVRKSNADGYSMLLHLNSPGDTMGYRAFLAGEDYHASAEALEPSRVCRIDTATVRSLLNQNPALGLRYLKKVSRNLVVSA
jgi:CRP-like cAMP-binding protein